jgi:low temperature requirement protein LtrA
MTSTHRDTILRVTNAELFFDLVFIFTIGQITHLIHKSHGIRNIAEALLVLVIIWYNYSGFIWLINSIGKRKLIFPVLLLAMTAFFLMAIAIPEMYVNKASIFGLSYSCAVFIHLLTFSLVYWGEPQPAILKLWFVNGLMAVNSVTASFAPPEWRLFFLFFAAITPFIASISIFRKYNNFEFKSAHFIERHSLVILIALGESILSIGNGATSHGVNIGTISIALLGILLVATIWWSYFSGDLEYAEKSLESRSKPSREYFARVFWWAHLLMIAGILFIATSLKALVARDEPLTISIAYLLASGVAIYFMGNTLMRWIIGYRSWLARLGAFMVILGMGTTFPHQNGYSLLVTTELSLLFILISERYSGFKRRSEYKA